MHFSRCINVLLLSKIISGSAYAAGAAQAMPKICNPHITINESEWSLKAETWGRGDLEVAKIDPNSVMKQFKADIIIFYNSLFPSNDLQNQTLSCQKSPKTCKNDKFLLELERQDFLKRVILVLADAPLKFSQEGNNQSTAKEWSYPLAAALTHGQRIVFDLYGVGDGNPFYNLLLAGSPFKKNKIDMTRTAASHGFSSAIVKGQVVVHEEKLRGFQGTLKNFKIGLKGQHKGVNIALGGLGNPDKDNLMIAPEGYRYNPKNHKILSDIQHGHVYMQVAKFSKDRAAMMLGIEGSTPNCRGCEDMYGHKHTAKSGFQKSTGLASITGGEKMQPLLKNRGCPAPAMYGGMWVKINEQDMNHLTRLFRAVFSKPLAEQKELFKKLLQSTVPQAQTILKQSFPELYVVK